MTADTSVIGYVRQNVVLEVNAIENFVVLFFLSNVVSWTVHSVPHGDHVRTDGFALYYVP